MRQERRRYFRIDTNSIVICKPIDALEKKTGIEKLRQGDIHYPDQQRLFLALEADVQEGLNRVKSRAPDIAMLLDLFNRKINLLADHNLKQSVHTILDQPAQPISISACGIAFHSGEALEQNQDVQWELVLLPDKIYILGYGRVVGCDAENDSFLVRVDFEALREEDLERLLQYIMRKESEWIKTKQPIGQSKGS